jgi:hypothetical protein
MYWSKDCVFKFLSRINCTSRDWSVINCQLFLFASPKLGSLVYLLWPSNKHNKYLYYYITDVMSSTIVELLTYSIIWPRPWWGLGYYHTSNVQYISYNCDIWLFQLHVSASRAIIRFIGGLQKSTIHQWSPEWGFLVVGGGKGKRSRYVGSLLESWTAVYDRL